MMAQVEDRQSPMRIITNNVWFNELIRNQSADNNDANNKNNESWTSRQTKRAQRKREAELISRRFATPDQESRGVRGENGRIPRTLDYYYYYY